MAHLAGTLLLGCRQPHAVSAFRAIVASADLYRGGAYWAFASVASHAGTLQRLARSTSHSARAGGVCSRSDFVTDGSLG